MLEMGRLSKSDTAIAAAIGDLEQGDFYARYMSLYSCAGSDDGAHVLRSLRDPSRIIQGLAIGMVAPVCDDRQAADALEALSDKSSAILLRRLFKARRHTAIDRHIDVLASRSDLTLPSLLPLGSEAKVRELLDGVIERMDDDDWDRLATFHPILAAETIVRLIDAAVEPDARLGGHVTRVVYALAARKPAELLRVVQSVLRLFPISKFPLSRVARHYPNEVADIILGTQDRASVKFEKSVRDLTTDRLARLLEKRPEVFSWVASFLHKLPPEMRTAVFHAVGTGWRNSEGVVDASIVKLLPEPDRSLEAERIMALPAMATRSHVRLPFAALLGWDRAYDVLKADLGNPDAVVRAMAIAALISSARYNRIHIPNALKVVLSRANEQDPVRLSMACALADLPPGRWQAEDLEGLGQIIRDALNAADLSPGTAAQFERLVLALAPRYPAWAAQWLATIVKERGQIHFGAGTLDDRLSDRDVLAIEPFLTPVFAAWQTREREAHLVAACNWLGRRMRVMPGIVHIAEEVIRKSISTSVVSSMLRVLQKRVPERFALLIPEILAGEPSFITLSEVYLYVHQRRQDLLGPFLGQEAYRGRFSAGNTRFVLPVSRGFHRWTPTQQIAFANTLIEVTHDKERDTPALIRVVTQLSHLPAAQALQSETNALGGPARLRLEELSQPTDGNQALRDASLRVLARLDAGEGIGELLRALGDRRAAIAIYALRTAILDSPPDYALSLLRGVSLERVTIAKEVFRLIGDLRTPEAFDVVLEAAQQPLHRDVRIAVLRALWEYPEEERGWNILLKAAADPDPAVAAGVIRVPTDRRSNAARLRLVELLTLLLRHPDVRVRRETLQRCDDLPLADPERLLLPRILASLSSVYPDESTAAAMALFGTYMAQDMDAISEAVRLLLPNRRSLQMTVNALMSAASMNRSNRLPTVRAVLDILNEDRLAASLGVELAVKALPLDELPAFFTHSSGEADVLDAGVLAVAVSTIERLGGSRFRNTISERVRRSYRIRGRQEMFLNLIAHSYGSWQSEYGSRDPAELLAFETSLAGDSDERLRRLALAALVAQGNGPLGWAPELIARLENYRRDESPLVAAAAQFTFPPPEAV